MLMQHNLHLLGMVAASILAVAPTDAFAQAKEGEQTPVTGSYNIVVFLTICISYANNCFTL